jgi:F-type H+-transporting ATPase subunit delta
MSDNVIVIRYARALAEVAFEKNIVAEVTSDLRKLSDLLDPGVGEIEVPELLDFLLSSTVPQHEKIAVTDTVCEQLNIGQTISDFLNVLIKRNRTQITPNVRLQFEMMSLALADEKLAIIETAYELNASQEKTIQKKLHQVIGAEVKVKQQLNKNLIGGVRIRIGDLQFDGSLANRLKRVRTSLATK